MKTKIEKRNATISFRPSKDGLHIIDSLKKMAAKEHRTLNNYLETVFLNHIKQNGKS